MSTPPTTMAERRTRLVLRPAVDREVAERALAQVVGNKVEAAYGRSNLLERRRAVMQAWSQFLSGEDTAKVVKLRAGRR